MSCTQILQGLEVWVQSECEGPIEDAIIDMHVVSSKMRPFQHEHHVSGVRGSVYGEQRGTTRLLVFMVNREVPHGYLCLWWTERYHTVACVYGEQRGTHTVSCVYGEQRGTHTVSFVYGEQGGTHTVACVYGEQGGTHTVACVYGKKNYTFVFSVNRKVHIRLLVRA